MYYILADQKTGELIQVSTSPIIQDEYQIVKIRSGEIPDLDKYEWNASSLCFIEKQAASRFVTHTSFLKRLTEEEVLTVYNQAETNINVRIWLDRFKMAQEVWLDHPDLVNGLIALFGEPRTLEIIA